MAGNSPTRLSSGASSCDGKSTYLSCTSSGTVLEPKEGVSLIHREKNLATGCMCYHSMVESTTLEGTISLDLTDVSHPVLQLIQHRL